MKYYLSSNDQVTGPYSRAELVDSMKYGMVSEESRVCPEGTDDWIPIKLLTHHGPAEAPKPAPSPFPEPTSSTPQQLESEPEFSLQSPLQPRLGVPPEDDSYELAPKDPFSDLRASEQDPSKVYNKLYEKKSPKTAVLLEVLPGIFLQTFGIGNIYAGNVGVGVTLMLTYWALLVLNIFLVFVIIGIITWPLTCAIYIFFAVMTARNAVARANWKNIMVGERKGA